MNEALQSISERVAFISGVDNSRLVILACIEKKPWADCLSAIQTFSRSKEETGDLLQAWRSKDFQKGVDFYVCKLAS
jgi:hypothetical protein